MTEWRDEDAELVARLVAATRPVRARAGWRAAVWEQIEAPPRRSWGLALAAAVSFVAVLAASWVPVWAADRAADRREAESWAERWAVRGEILRVAGEVRAWEQERAATVAVLARNDAERRALLAELALPDDGARRVDARLDRAPGAAPRIERARDADSRRKPERAKPTVRAACSASDPLCGL